jgi:hypothetical protein
MAGAHFDRISADQQRQLRTSLVLRAEEYGWRDDELAEFFAFAEAETRACRERFLQAFAFELDTITVSPSRSLH